MSLRFYLGHLPWHHGNDGLVTVGGNVVDVVDLAAVDEGEAVEDVEMLLSKEQETFRSVQALDATGPVHVRDLLSLFEQSEKERRNI